MSGPGQPSDIAGKVAARTGGLSQAIRGGLMEGLNSNAVEAQDGSTITWTKSPDGTITAVGSEARQLVVTPVSGGADVQSGEMSFSSGGSIYLSLTSTVDHLHNKASIGISGGDSAVTLTITPTSESAGTGSASGQVDGKPFAWNGPVNLSGKPAPALAVVSGAFAAQLGQAAYFAPAVAAITGVQSTHTRPRLPHPGLSESVLAGAEQSSRTQAGAGLPGASQAGSSPVVVVDDISLGKFLGKAAAWGAAAVIGAVAVAGGPITLIGGAVVFLAAADASMVDQVITDQGDSGTTTQTGDAGAGTGSEGSGDDGSGGDDGGEGDGTKGQGAQGDGTEGDGTDDDGTVGEGGGGGCFAAGTVVATADGSRQAIETLTIGDMLASRDERSAVDGRGQVLRTFIHPNEQTVNLRLAGGETILTTKVHRVFSVEHGLVQVAKLRRGDHLLTLSGPPQAIEDLAPAATVTVFNLTVEGAHTYFVGKAGVWVHNDKDSDPDGGDQGIEGEIDHV